MTNNVLKQSGDNLSKILTIVWEKSIQFSVCVWIVLFFDVTAWEDMSVYFTLATFDKSQEVNFETALSLYLSEVFYFPSLFSKILHGTACLFSLYFNVVSIKIFYSNFQVKLCYFYLRMLEAIYFSALYKLPITL